MSESTITAKKIMFNDVINNGGLFEVKLDRYLMKYVDSLIVNTSAS